MQEIACLIANNLTQPGRQMTASSKSVSALQGVHQTLLDNVFGILMVVNHAEGKTIKLLERVLKGVMIIHQVCQGLRELDVHN